MKSHIFSFFKFSGNPELARKLLEVIIVSIDPAYLSLLIYLS